MKRLYINPKLTVINLITEGVVANSNIKDAGGHGPNMPWGSSKSKDIWEHEEKEGIWK